MSRSASLWSRQTSVLGILLGLGLATGGGALAIVDSHHRTRTTTTTTATSTTETTGLTSTSTRQVPLLALVKPDSVLHPGAIDPTLTTARLCSRTFSTKTVRPPTSYTNKLKKLEIGNGGTITAPNGTTYQVTGEHLPGTPSDYELDHLISLELGGNPTDPKNLWLEAWERRDAQFLPAGEGAESKDVIENRLHREVCAGTVPLNQAQQEIATDWTTAT